MTDFPGDSGSGKLKPGRPLGSTRLMSPRHKEIMRRLLLGETQKQISDRIGMGQDRISIVVNAPTFQRNLKMMEAALEETFVERLVEKEVNDPVRELLDSYKVDAVKEIYLLMRGAESEQVRRTSAQDILDRAGYRPKEVVETSHNFKVDPHTSSNINQALQDLGVTLGEDYADEGEGEGEGEGEDFLSPPLSPPPPPQEKGDNTDAD